MELGCARTMLSASPRTIARFEDPVHLILDRPMSSGNGQQPFGRHVFRQKEIAHDAFATLAVGFASAADARDRNNPREFVFDGQRTVADNHCATPFTTIVSGWFELLGDAAVVRPTKQPLAISKQRTLILLERQHVIGTLAEHFQRKGAVAMQRIRCNNTAVQAQKDRKSVV